MLLCMPGCCIGSASPFMQLLKRVASWQNAWGSEEVVDSVCLWPQSAAIAALQPAAALLHVHSSPKQTIPPLPVLLPLCDENWKWETSGFIHRDSMRVCLVSEIEVEVPHHGQVSLQSTKSTGRVWAFLPFYSQRQQSRDGIGMNSRSCCTSVLDIVKTPYFRHLMGVWFSAAILRNVIYYLCQP